MNSAFIPESGTRNLEPFRTSILTTLALVAFAANSVLCRMALGDAAIDAASFSTIRLASGAAMLLAATAAIGRGPDHGRRAGPVPALLLFLYAVPFSFAYLGLDAGAGALILFGAVQATMILAAIGAGERPHAFEWLGLGVALGGLVYLVWPGLDAPPLPAFGLMAVAGVSWGVYSLYGRGAANPLADTTINFARTVPPALALSMAVIVLGQAHVSARGVLLAVLSGAVTSGLGYVIWYAALRGLTATRAATVQLAVPVLAAGGGIVFLHEALTLRVVLAAVLILGGVGLALQGRTRILADRSIG